jgi:hypothetical protein
MRRTFEEATVIQCVCYVDFFGELSHTVCGEVCDPDYSGTTIYLNSTTCPACWVKIQERIAQMAAEPLADQASVGR